MSRAPNSQIDARRTAVALLRGVLERREQLSEVLKGDGLLLRLSPGDRARAQRLAMTTLRHLRRADTMLGQFVEKLPPSEALTILRLAVVEICVEGEAPHGVVDSAVTLMRATGKSRRMGGMANAVLRQVATEGPALWDDLEPAILPKWLRRRMIHMYKEPAVEAIEAAHTQGAPLDVTVKADAALWAEKLNGELLPTGSIRLHRNVQVTELPGFDTGDWWVQDAAAAVAVQILAPQPEETILDLCAAPGGKTMQLAASGAQVTALDQSKERLSRVAENLERTKLNAELIQADALDWDAPQKFDAIVLDAPCSATGTIRRHPDLPYVKTGQDLDQLFELQAGLLEAAYDMLKPGGRMVFCTCSLLAEEGELQIKRARQRLGFEVTDIPFETLGLDPQWSARDDTGVRLRPDYWAERGGMDGFFITLLRKPK
ncbi:MAG: transcription antitermination factor NusB [Litoreibacter sp.]